MDRLDKQNIFREYLDTFETEEMKRYCRDMIGEIPEYIFEIPSSTSFKYHNKTQCQQHGQIMHILMFGEIMNYILGLEYAQIKFPHPKQRDCFRCTPIFHDALKCGLEGSKYTVHEHPMLASKWIKETIVEHDIDTETKEYIARLCESHSGQWRENPRSNVKLPGLENDEQFLVHLCDYLSSRNNIDMIYSRDIIDRLNNIETDYKIEVPEVSEYIIDFGKYKDKGFTLIDIKNKDKSYFNWLKENYSKEPVKSLLKLVD